MQEENTMNAEKGAAREKALTAEGTAAQGPAGVAHENGTPAHEGAAALPSKFKSVDALVQAYEALEAEFTRRSQRLRALEQAKKDPPQAQGEPSPVEQACAARALPPNAETVMNVPSVGEEAEKPLSLPKEPQTAPFVPLMTHAGAGVAAPAVRPKTFEEAGRLALGYLRHAKKGE